MLYYHHFVAEIVLILCRKNQIPLLIYLFFIRRSCPIPCTILTVRRKIRVWYIYTECSISTPPTHRCSHRTISLAWTLECHTCTMYSTSSNKTTAEYAPLSFFWFVFKCRHFYGCLHFEFRHTHKIRVKNGAKQMRVMCDCMPTG